MRTEHFEYPANVWVSSCCRVFVFAFSPCLSTNSPLISLFSTTELVEFHLSFDRVWCNVLRANWNSLENRIFSKWKLVRNINILELWRNIIGFCVGNRKTHALIMSSVTRQHYPILWMWNLESVKGCELPASRWTLFRSAPKSLSVSSTKFNLSWHTGNLLA